MNRKEGELLRNMQLEETLVILSSPLKAKTNDVVIGLQTRVWWFHCENHHHFPSQCNTGSTPLKHNIAGCSSVWFEVFIVRPLMGSWIKIDMTFSHPVRLMLITQLEDGKGLARERGICRKL